MIGVRGGIDNWGGSRPTSTKWGVSRPTSTHLNSYKDHKDQEDDILDSDLDVELSHFDHTSAIGNFSQNANLNFSDDSPEIKHNPLAFLFNNSSEVNADQQKPVNELPSSNWLLKSQESNLKPEQNVSHDLLKPYLNDDSPLEQSSNTKINPLSQIPPEQEDKTKVTNNKPSSNWLLNPKHRLSQKTSSPSSQELIGNDSTQTPFEQDYNSYDNDNFNNYNENMRYNENYRSENEDAYENNFNDNEYNNNYEENGNHFEHEYNRGTFFHVDKYNNGQYSFKRGDNELNHPFSERSNDHVVSPNRDEYRDEYREFAGNHINYDQPNNDIGSLRISRKTRGERNRESTLGQIRRSLDGNISDSSFDGNHKTNQHSLPDSNSKHFQLSMTTIPPTGNSLPPMPEPDYDISDATFYIPPPDY